MNGFIEVNRIYIVMLLSKFTSQLRIKSETRQIIVSEIIPQSLETWFAQFDLHVCMCTILKAAHMNQIQHLFCFLSLTSSTIWLTF